MAKKTVKVMWSGRITTPIVKYLYTIVKKIYNLYNSTKLQNIDN